MLLKRIISIAAAAITAAAMLISLTACGKENVVNTDEGKKLTAHAWQTNYTGHSEVTFETDGTLKVKTNSTGEEVEVPGKWSIDGTTLTTTIEKQLENGELVDKESTVTYVYSDYMKDKIIDGGDESIKEAREKYEKGTQWYVSDKYLYFAGSVWIPKE